MIIRKKYLEDLIQLKDKNIIKVITGIRRCGKSTLFELYQDYLLQSGVSREQIISVNLEDGDYRNIRTAETLYTYVAERLIENTMNYVFLDEAQQAENFQEAVDWLYVKKNVDLYHRFKCISAVRGTGNPVVREVCGDKNAAPFL